eukprot:2770152-Prymnesium_polylepis.2
MLTVLPRQIPTTLLGRVSATDMVRVIPPLGMRLHDARPPSTAALAIPALRQPWRAQAREPGRLLALRQP